MKHRPELDGIRGVAVLIVLLGHADLLAFASAGVVMFFVLSGFLITRLLTTERDRTGAVSLPAFYRRRMARLYPALVTVVIVTGVLVAIAGRHGYGREAFLSLTYLTGVLRAWFGAPVLPRLDLTWSLSVEELFYLIWPVLLLVALRWRSVRPVVLTGGLLAVAALWHVALWLVAGPEHAYFGLDGNAYALLTGCTLALSGVDIRLRAPSWVGPVGLAVVLATADGKLPITDVHVLSLGMLLVAAGTALVIWTAMTHDGFLGAPWLTHLGVISYGVYLWQAATLNVFGSATGLVGTWRLLAIPASIGAAWLSYRYVERPVTVWAKRRSAPMPVSRAALAA